MRKGLGRHNRRSAGGLQPSLILDFAGTGTLDSRITFTRSTTATYYNSSGVLSTAAINAARFDYNPSTLAPLGLLIEQSSTNIDLYSQDFSNVVWVKNAATVTSGATTAPDGTTTGNLLVPTAISTNHYITQIVTFTGIGTLSFYAKAKEYTAVSISNSPNNYIHFDLTNGNISTLGTGWGSATCTAVGNGWYRCTGTNSASQTWGQTVIFGLNSFIANGNTAPSFTGNGTSGVYIWGAQLEALAFATSYIATTSAQVTRAADNASMTGTNFSSWYNNLQGTVYGECTSSSGSFTDSVLFGGNSNGYQLRLISSIPKTAIRAVVDLITTGTTLSNIATTGVKIAGFYQSGNNGATGNGNTPTTSATTFTIVTPPTSVNIGSDALTGGTYLNGRIKKISYYPTALTSAQIQALTT